MFPYQLAVDHILSWSVENDIIFDPFLGSGTTAVAALHNNRRFLGVEINEKYFNDSVEYVKEEENKLHQE